MSKPNINIPAEFAINGTKTDFSQSKITDGFDRLQPDVLSGDNLNKFIDDTYKGLNGVLELFEGCVLYDSTVTYNNKSIVFYINSDDKVEVYRSLINNNLNNPLDDDTAWKKVELGGSGYEVGDIIIRNTPTNDAGKHLLDGTLIQYGSYIEFVDYIAGLVTDYPDLFVSESDWQTSVATYGVCGKFVYDSVNNTVRLPKITGIVEGTTDLTAISDLVEAGLPNLSYVIDSYGNISTTGTPGLAANGTSNWHGVKQNANIQNSIYGNSSTVQPQTIKVLYYIVIANSTKTDIQVDIDQIATDLNGKADVDLTNVNDSGTSRGAGWAMPSDTYEDLTLGASGTEYTAPANGYYTFSKATGGTSNYNSLDNITKGFKINVAGASATMGVFIPVEKGDIVKVWYTSTGNTQWFKFIYAVGSESEAQ